MAYTPYYDKSGKEYKVQSHSFGNKKQYQVIDIDTGKRADINRNTLSKEKPSTKVRTFDAKTGDYTTYDNMSHWNLHSEQKKIKIDKENEEKLNAPRTKKDDTANVYNALARKDSNQDESTKVELTDGEKKFLYDYAPNLYPQYAPPEKPVDPMKGMNELEKANYRVANFGKDKSYINTVQSYADSSTIYDKTKLPQFMLTREKSTKINKINSKIEALTGEIDSYVRKRDGKPDYVSPKNQKALAKARANLKFEQSELLKFKGLKQIDPDPLGLFPND